MRWERIEDAEGLQGQLMWPACELGCGRFLLPTQRGLASSSRCNTAALWALESLSSAFAVEVSLSG